MRVQWNIDPSLLLWYMVIFRIVYAPGGKVHNGL